MSAESRLQAIEKARESFSHDVQAVHDEELEAGADGVLTKHLAFVVWPLLFEAKPMHDLEDVIKELSLILGALESVYRASSEVVGKSFDRVGHELVKLILTVLSKELDRRVDENLFIEDQVVKSEWDGRSDDERFLKDVAEQSPESGEEATCSTPPDLISEVPQAVSVFSPEGDNLIRHGTRILGHFARVGNVTKALAHHPGLLGTLLRLISVRPFDRVPWEARLAAIWTLANLGCNGENMQMMVSTPGLIDALITVSCRSVHPADSVERTVEVLRGRSIASRCILNLSWAPENKIVLGKNYALVDLLAELAVHRHSPLAKGRTVREILVTTRRHALGALRNLAAAPRLCKIALAEHKNGRLLSVLTDAALNDPDKSVTDRALAAISNMAVHDTAEQMVNHPALVLALKNVLLSTEQDATFSEEGTPRAHASATLMVLERSIRPDMPAYQNLRNLQDALNPSTSSSRLDEMEEDPMKVEQVTAD